MDIMILTLWIISKFSAIIGTEISSKAYKHTLYRPYSEQIMDNSSKTVTSISQRVNNTVQGIYGFLQIATGSISILGIFLGLLIADYSIAFISLFLIGMPYLLINKLTSKKLSSNSKKIAARNNLQVQLIQEGMGSIREIYLGGFKKNS